MKRHSKLAVVSFIFGLAAALLALTRTGPLLVFAILLGLLALGISGISLWFIRKRSPMLQGKRLAISAAWMGITGTVLGLLFLTQIVFREINQQRRRQQVWTQSVRAQEAMVRSPLPDEVATNFTSNLPIVVLQTTGRPISKHSDTVVHAEFFDTSNGRASCGAKPDYAGPGTINLRGYTSLHLPKRSYTFHTVDENKNQIKVPLLGLPAEEDWVLYASFEDKTLMRDVLAFELANKMGQYAPRTRYIELFIKSSDRPVSMNEYAGIYVLVEKIKRGKDRVNVAKLEKQHRAMPEISGGYIVKRDHGDRGDNGFSTERGGPYFFVYPKADDITPEQKTWLARYFRSFESALYGQNFEDSKLGYAAFLDVDSFIDAHWLIELSKNVDGFRYSAFLTKDRGGKIKPGPAWDWNRSFGNANYYGGWQVHGWYSANLRPNEISWSHRLREDPNFVQRSNTRWIELRRDVLDPKRISGRIDELAAQLEEAQQRNFDRWPILGQHVTCNYFVGQTYQEEVAWLKNWIYDESRGSIGK